MSDKPRERSAPATGPPPGGSAVGGGERGAMLEQWERGGGGGGWGGGATGGQPPVGHGLGALVAAFVLPVYNTQVGTSPGARERTAVGGGTPPDGMGHRGPPPAILWAGAADQCLHAHRGSGLSSSLMTQVGTGTVPVAGPSGCVPPAPRGQGTRPVPPAPREQGGSATRRAEFVRPVGRAPLRDCSITGFQVVRRRRDGAPGPRPASAGWETGSRVSGASLSGSGVPRWRSHSCENMRPRASGPQGPRPQDAAPRKRDRLADSVGVNWFRVGWWQGWHFQKEVLQLPSDGAPF